MKRLATKTEPALQHLAAIEAAVAVSGDEDLLDVADILVAGDPAPLRAMAKAQMRGRGPGL